MYIFTKFTYNEYIGPYILSHVVCKKIASDPPSLLHFIIISSSPFVLIICILWMFTCPHMDYVHPQKMAIAHGLRD